MKTKKNAKVGVLLQSGINEFDLAAILDTYRRSFPGSIETYIAEGTSVTSKYGLTLFATGDINSGKCTELHILIPESFPKSDENLFIGAELIRYEKQQKQYIIDVCLSRILGLYGSDFCKCCKINVGL